MHIPSKTVPLKGVARKGVLWRDQRRLKTLFFVIQEPRGRGGASGGKYKRVKGGSSGSATSECVYLEEIKSDTACLDKNSVEEEEPRGSHNRSVQISSRSLRGSRFLKGRKNKRPEHRIIHEQGEGEEQRPGNPEGGSQSSGITGNRGEGYHRGGAGGWVTGPGTHSGSNRSTSAPTRKASQKPQRGEYNRGEGSLRTGGG